MSDPVFFAPSRRFTAGEIAALTGAELRTPEFADNIVTGLAPADRGGTGTLVFVEGRRNAGLIAGVEASALLCSADIAASAGNGIAVLVSSHPQRDFATVGRLMFPAASRPGPVTGETGLSPAAHIHPQALVEAGAIVEAGAVIGPDAQVGSGTVIAPNAVIGPSCRIGRDGYVGPGVTIQHALLGNRVIVHAGARIGQDGFGYVLGRAGLEKMPQLARVVIQDDVEIGANTTIDRGTLSDTVIGEGTKIDNLVQIAHNVRIGAHTAVAGCVGIAGSTVIGARCMIGGQAGIIGHLHIVDDVVISAGTLVTKSIHRAGVYTANLPVQPHADWVRNFAHLRHLDALMDRLRALEQRLDKASSAD